MQGRLEELEPEHARRSEGRRKLFLAASAEQAEATQPVEVLNISPSGMLVRTAGKLDLDESLAIVLPELGEREASIVWAAEDLYGCRFASTLSAGEVSTVLLKAVPLYGEVPAPAPDQVTGFGEILRDLRRKSGQSMEDFAAHLGITKPTLWKWETGRVRPRAKALKRISAILGMSEKALLYGVTSAPDFAPAAKSGGRKEELVDTIARCREEIAAGAGVASEKVSIGVNWA